MTTLTVTAKGQVTLRKALLTHMGVQPGDKVEVEALANGRIAMSVPRKRTGKFSELSGRLKRPGQPTLTIEEMNEVIADGWAGIRR